jgi:hypothetical protein
MRLVLGIACLSVARAAAQQLDNCVALATGTLNLRWTLAGEELEYEIEGAVGDGMWMGFGFAAGT